MTITITVPISKYKDQSDGHFSYCNLISLDNFSKENMNTFHTEYQLKMPTHVSISFLEETLVKMKEMEKLCIDHDLQEIQILSNYNKDLIKSTFQLYHNEEHIQPTFYEECDEKHLVFHDNCFTISYDKMYNGFRIEMIFTNSVGEFILKTEYFKIDSFLI